MKNNSILCYKNIRRSDAAKTGTTLTFFSPIMPKDNNFYSALILDDMKEKLLRNFTVLFCSLRDSLPSINLSFVVDGKIQQKLAITSSDIAVPKKTFSILVPYKTNVNGKVVETDESATIDIRAFVMPKDDLKNNEIVLTAKGESIDSNIKLECLKDIDAINGKRYLFFLASDYFDEHIRTNRGQIELLTYDDFAKQDAQLFDSKVLLLDDICDKTNKEIAKHFPEIQEHYNTFHANIKELQEMFLLDPDVIRKVKLYPSDDDKSILSKIYDYDKDIIAEKDAELKGQLDSLKNLTPGNEDYETALSQVVDDFARLVPLQNRASLTRYVARRQLILKEFELILQHGLNCQEKSSSAGGKNQRSADEKLLHNLIFPQKSSDTYNSALWILNEEFIYFNGVSESRLCDVKTANGEKIFRQDVTAKEEEYLHEFGEHREELRPDIMLFPEEHKAIIIELKAPDVPPYKHITQIQQYASLLMNYCEEKFSISTFYGYLIGEQIDFRYIRHVNPYFKDASKFGYIFCPNQPVVNDKNGTDGSLYMEVIKYSALLERALLRNKIYRDKLGIDFNKTK